MSSWSVSLDKAPVFEAPNAVAYVTYESDDGRKQQARVPYDAEDSLLNYLAKECNRLSAFDARSEAAKGVVANTTLSAGKMTLPDISAQAADEEKRLALNQKIASALQQKQINDAAAIDPTIAVEAAATVLKG